MTKKEPAPGSLPDAHARVPIDKVAARVTRRGIRFVPQKEVPKGTLHSSVPPAMHTDYPKTMEDLRGRQFGLFTVVGRSLESHPKKGAKWVVRCACGRYSYRYRASIMNAHNEKDRCEECRHLLYLQRSDRFRRTGSNGGDR